MLDKNGFNNICTAKHGTFLYNKNDTFVGKSLATYGEWSEEEVDLFKDLCRPGDTVVEAGSNIGTHTIPLAKIVGKNGRIFSFEAQRIIFQTLNANIALNHLSNVYAYNIAVGAENGSVVIPNINYEQPENFGAIRAHSHQKGERAPLVALDSFLKISSLNFLKADIEDMEVELLKGSTQLIEKFRPILYLESEPSKDYSKQLISKLLPLYEKIYWHIPSMFNTDNHAKNDENIFGSYASFNLLCIPKDCERTVDIERFKLKEVTSADSKPF